jgi:hypothetical protein
MPESQLGEEFGEEAGGAGATAATDSTYSRGAMDTFWANALWSISPTILIGLIFWLVMRSIIRADRTERKVYAQIEAEERAKLGLDKPVT